MTSDFQVENHGSIFLLRPLTEAADDWVGQHIPDDAMWFGLAVAVEHRFIAPIIEGIASDGLVVE